MYVGLTQNPRTSVGHPKYRKAAELSFSSVTVMLRKACELWGTAPLSCKKRTKIIKLQNVFVYRKVPKFSDARKLCCILPKIQTKRPNFKVFLQKAANGIANIENPDQTAPLGAG